MLCLSHQATLNMLDVVADGHDEKVWEWKENQMNHIGDAATQVSWTCTQTTCVPSNNL